jgi:threonylcarbamoyladenosine tRNA methylthiotransferase MtaB
VTAVKCSISCRRKKRRAFYESQLGNIDEVLFEGDIKDGYMHGFSKNYVKVRTAYDPLLVNEVVPVKFLEISENGDVDIEELPEVLAH